MDDNVDVKFLRTNANGFKNAETDLLELGWKEKRFTRATNKDIKRAYFVFLVKENNLNLFLCSELIVIMYAIIVLFDTNI